MTSPPTQSSTSSRKPSILPVAPVLLRAVADCEPSAQVLFPGTWGGAWPMSTGLRRVHEDSLAGRQGVAAPFTVLLSRLSGPRLCYLLADLRGQEAKATISRHLAAKGPQVSTLNT